MIVTLLATGMGLAGCTNTSKRVATSPTTSSAENTSISVVLPTLADVELTKGEPKSGRVTKITDKELSIELSAQAEAIAIKDIKRVKFKQEAPLPRGSNPRLRSDSEVWRVMPMTDFQIKDSSKGLAEVQQSAVVKEKQPPSDFLGEPSSYEVNEMWFDSNSPGTMRLKVKGIN
ncbi:MAG: hypothetical protein AB1589_28145 [Cyanobacteriota bacterium]